MSYELTYPQGQARMGEGTLLDEVYALWKRHSATLGFLPFTAFNDRAVDRQLLAARLDDVVVGYVLFDLPRTGQIILRHVCVAKSERGRGLARIMTDQIIADHPERLEIAADCREDYGLHGFWTKLGMTPRAERPGRRQLGSVLTRWRRSLGQLDLIEAALLASPLPLAVLDSNVVTDLCSAAHVHRDRAEESAGLNASWLQDHLVWAVSGQLDEEIRRTVDVAQRAALRTGSQHWVRLRTTRPTDTSLEDELLGRLGPATTQDKSFADDVLHVADAIRADAAYFVTNDDNFISHTDGWLRADYGIEAIRPHVLIGRIRSNIGQPSFVPRLIDSVNLDWVTPELIDAQTTQNAFTAHRAGERGRLLLQRLADARSHPQTTRVQILVNGRSPWALLAERRDGDELVVPLLRVAAGPQALTVALQLARHLRRRAVRVGCSRVRVTDITTDATVVGEALREDGYTIDDNAFVVNPIGETQHLPGLTAVEVSDRERLHYPLAVVGADMPAAVIPIQPRFAEGLLGYAADTLLQLRSTALGVLRQHVYFHKPSGSPLTVPSRLLWYVTADDLAVTRRLVARSRIIGSEVLPAEEAHAIYRELGVLPLREIRAAANPSGDVHVIRFEDTELLERELSRHQVLQLNRQHGIHGNFQSVRTVPSAYFDDVMRLQDTEHG